MPPEHTNLAGSVDQALYPVAVLIDELSHDDRLVRLRSMRSLDKIATTLGPERTREELLPYLQEMLDDEDELQVALAEELGKGMPWVGGPDYLDSLTAPLEELCSQEESTVRDKAAESLMNLFIQAGPEAELMHATAVIGRLAGHDSWFTSRMSASGLLASVLPKVPTANRGDLLKVFLRLCGDETPMVRRSAAGVLGDIAKVAPGPMMAEMLDAFEKFSKDEQESVRILTIPNCASLGKLRPSGNDLPAKILPVIKACAEDKSWRVRYSVAEHMDSLCEVFRPRAVSDIVPLYLQLLQDQEAEVRACAADRLAAVSKLKPDKDFLETLMPVLEKFAAPRERSVHARAALAGSVMSLAPVFGAKLTTKYLVDLSAQLVRDESPEVRLKLLGTLGELSSVLGVEVLSQSLMPCIKELGKDRQWRVRLMVINCMPPLAKFMGERHFTEELSVLFVAWLEDPVYSVRDATAKSIRRLYEVLGLAWCETHIVPRLQALLAHANYLYRISAVLCAGRLAEVASGPFLEKHIVPLISNMAADVVPNVRFNAAKVIQSIMLLDKKKDGLGLTPCLRRQLDDSDPDVKYFARRALTETNVSA